MERHKDYEHFYQGYKFIVQALELIGHKKHLETYGDMYPDWYTANRSEAQQILAVITSFGFIVSFMNPYKSRSHSAGITVKLQKRSLDIMQAHQMVIETIDTYRGERQVDNRGFDSIFEASVKLGDEVGGFYAKNCNTSAARK